MTRPVLVAPDKFKGTLMPRRGGGRDRARAAGGRRRATSSCCRSPTAARARWRRSCGRAAAGSWAPRDRSARARGRGRVRAARRAAASRSSSRPRRRGCGGCATIERDAVAASSHGTGELIGAAIDAGAREVVVDRRRQRHDRRRPRSAGGAGRALHLPHRRPARAAPHACAA